MNRYVVLLRGINVGGRNRLAMAELRAALAAAGYDRVSTYIQSGNIALSAPTCDGEEISELIADNFGLTVPTVVRTEDQLQATIDSNPFPEMVEQPKWLHVYFCQGPIDTEAAAALDHDRHLPDRMVATANEVFVAYADGVAGSKLTNPVLDRALGQVTTARNWNTVLKLIEMAKETP